MTNFDETLASEFHAACIQNGYNMEDVIADPMPFLKGFIASRERERQMIGEILKENKESVLNGTFEAKVMAGEIL